MLQEDIDGLARFLSILEWLLPVSARYTDSVQVGLVLIDFGNPRILGEAYGAGVAARKLDEISYSLRRAFRKTDMVARDGTDFWILTPYTPVSEKLSDKIRDIIDFTSRSDLHFVERDISLFSLADHASMLKTDPTPQGFLFYLKQNHARLSRQQFALPASA